MARKLDLSAVSGTAGYPIISNTSNKRSGLDFISLMNDERFDALLRMFTNNSTAFQIMWGGVVTISGGNYSVTAGWGYYNYNPSSATTLGELFYIPAVSTTSMGGNSYLQGSINDNADLDDPIKYSDSSSQSPHRVRTVTFTPVAGTVVTPSYPNLPTTDNWINTIVAPLVLRDTVGLQNVSSTSWTSLTSITLPSDKTRTWRMDFLSAFVTAGNFITEDITVQFYDNTSSTSYASNSAGKSDYTSDPDNTFKAAKMVFAINLFDVQTLPAGHTIEVQVKGNQTSLSGTMNSSYMMLTEFK